MIDSWRRVRIKHIARIRYGLGQPPKLSETGIPIVRATNISDGKITDTGMIYANVADLPLDRAPLLEEGEILVVRSGAYTGDSAIVDKKWSESAPGYDLRITPKEIHPPYLAYALLSAPARQQIDLSKSRAAQPHLNAEDLGEIPIDAPSLNEQRRIADFLDAEVRRIGEMGRGREKQIALLDECAFTHLSETLVPGSISAPAKVQPWPWLPVLPDNLPLVRLGYVCQLQNGLTIDSGRDAGTDAVKRPYLRVANVQAGTLVLDEVSEVMVSASVAERCTLSPGDVLITEGGDLDKLGRGTVWNGELPNCLHQNHVFALRPRKDRIDSGYLALMTRTLHARCYFESTGVKTTNLASTNSSKVRGFPIPLPDLQKQVDLAVTLHVDLETISRTKSVLLQQMELLAERKQALITAAVTGQIDVTTARGVDVS